MARVSALPTRPRRRAQPRRSHAERTAQTRAAAEDAVKRAYPKKAERDPRDIPYDDEEAFMDDEDYEFGEKAKRGKFYTYRKRRSFEEQYHEFEPEFTNRRSALSVGGKRSIGYHGLGRHYHQ
jgi:hypothetical protein